MNLQVSDWLALGALVVAGVSLAISLYSTLLDRAKIKASSKLYGTWIQVKVVNHGRRPVILTAFGGDFAGGGWQLEHIGDKGLGVRLTENEFHTIDLKYHDIQDLGPEGNQDFVDLWFEDSQGRRHRIQNARRHLKEIKKT